MDEARITEFAERVAGDQSAAAQASLVALGDKLGLWAALAGQRAGNAGRAGRGDQHERALPARVAEHARSGRLRDLRPPRTGRFELPIEHAAVLADDQSPASLIGGFEICIAQWAALDRAAEAFRSRRGRRLARARPAPLHRLRPVLRAAVRGLADPAVDPRPRGRGGEAAGRRPGARRRLRPRQELDHDRQGLPGLRGGRDRQPRRVDRGRPQGGGRGRRVRAGHLRGRRCADVRGHRLRPRLLLRRPARHGRPGRRGRGHPRALDADGTLLLVEPLAGDRLEDNFHPLGVSYYASSTLLCVPNSLSQDVGAALGAQAGEARLREVLEDAGFARVRRACDAPFNLVLEAR